MNVVRVLSVEVIAHYRLRVAFDDGLVREVDLGHLRAGGPIFEPLQDPDYFSQARVDPLAGTVVWPNGADLDPLVLHGDVRSA